MRNLFILSIIFCALIFFAGCSMFKGQYEANSGLNNSALTGQDDFEKANKMIERRLDDIASGRATLGESPGGQFEDNSINQNNMNNDHSPAQEGPVAVIEPNKKYKAILNTEEGNIEINLFADQTPYTVNNFVFLSKKNFYNNTVFHRVINGFMIQGGDPNGDGSGNPGYQFADEPFEGEYDRGIVAMANSGPNTNGSQFFIMHADYPLPKNYVIFGKVLSGMEVVDKIAEASVKAGAGGETSTPIKPIKILSVNITEE